MTPSLHSTGLKAALEVDPDTDPLVCSVVKGGKVSLLGPGTCILDATQGGNAIYLPAMPVRLQFIVFAANTSVGISAPTHLSYGHEQGTVLTASVTGNVEVNEGKVSFTAGTTKLCKGVLVHLGVATCTISKATALHIGIFQLVASYADSGRVRFSSSSSSPFSVAVS